MKGSENPADLLTRGINSDFFLKSGIWLAGHRWLVQSNLSAQSSDVDVDLDVANTMSNLVVPDDETVKPKTCNNFKCPILIENYSSYKKSLKSNRLIYVLRFVSRVQKTQTLTSNLNAVEIRNAESLLLKLVQREHFPELINYFNGLNKKKPILVDQLRLCARNNLICTYSRPNNANISEVNKYLVLLPINSCLTFQIINNFHFEYFHAGVNSVLSQLRERFWLPRADRLLEEF